MKETTYEIDGVTYESTVTESWTVDVLNRWDMASTALRGELTKATAYSVQKAIDDAPLGLADVSILARWNKEQTADSNAMDNFIRTNYPKVAKRLYKPNESLWNFIINLTVCAFDQFDDEIKEQFENLT